MWKKIVGGLLCGVLALSGIAGMPALAADLCSDMDPDLQEAAGCNTTTTADQAANTIINTVLTFLGLVAVGVMIYGGIQFMISNGDPSKAKKARDAILYGLIGLIVACLAWVIVSFVASSVPTV